MSLNNENTKTKKDMAPSLRNITDTKVSSYCAKEDF